MPHRVASLAHRFPRRLLLLCLLATLGLAVAATGVPERLALGGGEVEGSESEAAAAALSAELAAEAEPSYILVLRGSDPVSAPSARVAIETLTLQVETIDGVGLVAEGRRSNDGRSTTLALHLEPGLSPERIREIGGLLDSALDPGPLEVLLGGPAATAEAARASALDDAPKLGLLALPLLALILAGSLGLRFGAATLLGGALATAASVAVLGPIGEAAGLEAIAVAACGLTAAILAIEVSASLLFRYREESSTLGPGAESLEYSLNTVLRSAALGMVGAGLVGVALLVVPIEFARSVGVGLIIASLLAPPLALLPACAALALRAESEVGAALPLLADGETGRRAPRSFRFVASIARDRRRAALALAIPLVAAVALTLPILDSESIGLSPTELPDGDPAQGAEAVLAGDFGVGTSGPLLVLSDGPPEAPTLTLYRDAILQLKGVSSVGLASAAGSSSVFEATPDSRPQSLAAQRTAAQIRQLPAPSARRIGGPGARMRDAGQSLADDLPLVALIAILGSAALWSLLFRAAFGPLLALAAGLAPLAGIGAILFVFSEGRLSGALDYVPAGAPHTESFVVVVAVLTAVGLSRGAGTGTALSEERALGGGVVGSVARSTVLTLMPAAVATLAGIALAGVWGGADLVAAKEIAVGLSAGLLADLVLVRLSLVPSLARASIRTLPR